jgi:hypothetical protein
MPYREKYEWGPFVWGLIHTVTIIDFENGRHALENAINILKRIPSVIPCYKCATHYQLYVIPELIIDKWLEPMSLFRFMVEYHNIVNTKFGKPLFTYEDALLKWSKII